MKGSYISPSDGLGLLSSAIEKQQLELKRYLEKPYPSKYYIEKTNSHLDELNLAYRLLKTQLGAANVPLQRQATGKKRSIATLRQQAVLSWGKEECQRVEEFLSGISCKDEIGAVMIHLDLCTGFGNTAFLPLKASMSCLCR